MNDEAATKNHVNGGLKDIAGGKSDVFKVDPRLIKTKPGWNLRNEDDPRNIAHIEQLTTSIIEWGIQTPLGVYMENGSPYVADGHCRLRACLNAIEQGHDIALVPCIALPRHFSEVDKLAMMAVRNGGKSPEPLEMAALLARMANYGLDDKAIAKKTGYTVQRVGELLRLNSAPVEIVELVKEGTISASLATKVVRESHGDDAEAVKVAQDAVATARTAGKERATAKHLKQRAAPGDLTRTPGYAKGIERCIEIAKGELTHCDAAILIELFEAELEAE